jgi:RimJ/RimL family protein N-acetyltransferase
MYHRTDRLLLRPLWPEDAAPLTALVNGWTTANAQDYLVRIDCAFGVQAHRLPDAPLIGVVRLDALAPGQAPELAYWIGDAFSGHGYATESAAAAVEVAFLGLGWPDVEASCTPNNSASMRVLHKLGFRPTRPARYSLTRSHWLRSRGLLDACQAA